MGTTVISGGRRTAGSKIIFTVIGLIFAYVGGRAVEGRWASRQEIKAMQQWVQAEGTMVSCSTEDDGEDFRLNLSYSYKVGGQQYTATRYGKRHTFTAEGIGEIKAAEKRYAAGRTLPVYYNPARPSEAVINQPTLKSANISLLIAAAFPTFGILIAVLPWMLKKRENEEMSPRGGRIFLILFGGIFAAVGLLMIKPFLIDPLQKTQSAKNWSTVPAEVVSSKVKSHSSDDGTTYSPYIAYRYEVGGTEYFGDQYTFMNGSSSGRAGKEAVVSRYPEGHRFDLFVNPNNPAESVINREAKAELLLGLVPAVFAVIGIAVISLAFRKETGRAPQLDAAQSRAHVVTLKGSSPGGRAVFITVFAVIWNGVVYLIWRNQAGWLFLSLFGFFGIVSIVTAVQNILAVFNPRPTAEITPGRIHPGTRAALRWRMSGRVERIRGLKIELKCLHVTTVTSGCGKNRRSRIIKTPQYEHSIFSSENGIAQGTAEFLIPDDCPASRPGNYDGIEWQLVFHGDIPRWPDIKDEFKFLVYPESPEFRL